VRLYVYDGWWCAIVTGRPAAGHSQQVHHVRSLCLNSSRANRIRQSYKVAGQLRRSRSQCTSKLLLKMHSVASSTDDARNLSSNSSNNSSTGRVAFIPYSVNSLAGCVALALAVTFV